MKKNLKVYFFVAVFLCHCASLTPLKQKEYRVINSEIGEDLTSDAVYLQKTTHMEIEEGIVHVRDNNLQNIEELRQALEALFKGKCAPAVQGSDGNYRLNVTSCMPVEISSFLGSRTRYVPGPECYSYALFPLGITPYLNRVMEASTEIFFTDNSAFCKKIDLSERRAGDIAYMGIHGFMYLTDRFSLGAMGAGRVFEISTVEENIALGGSSLKLKDVSFYRCKLPEVDIPKVTKQAAEGIHRFEKFLQKYLFLEGLTQENLLLIGKEIQILEKTLTKEAVDTLLLNSSNPLILLKLYSLTGMYYTISKIETRLKLAGAMQDLAKAKLFEKDHLAYLKILDRMAEPEHSMLFDTTTLSTIDTYCLNERSKIPNVCHFHDSYLKGELSKFTNAF